MSYGNDVVPLNDTDLNENTCRIWADEHRHRIVLHEMAHRKTKRVERRRARGTVTVGTLEDERL